MTQKLLYSIPCKKASVFYIFLLFLSTSSIANLNSTPIWNLILQIHLLSIVEFNLSEPSVKIMVINMTVSSQQEGTTYG